MSIESAVNDLHEIAMSLVDDGETSAAAMTECLAAELCPDVQPSKSVLSRIAAQLCLDAGARNSAREIALEGLKSAPEPIAEELREIIRKCCVSGDLGPLKMKDGLCAGAKDDQST